jgi:tRNA-2-methylthio-N6-dimethylallyladenosine synthase
VPLSLEVSRGFLERDQPRSQGSSDLTTIGVAEVTLIGQNVNSYRGGIDFAQLLLRVAQVPGIERVRFTTSHPHDLSPELIEAFRVEPKISPHFHLPVQCGSDPVLQRMRRDYTVSEYLDRLARLREARPGIAVTTDIIVGFPGETDQDFEGTVALTEKARFENQYSFVFSPRPKTAAGMKEAEWGPIAHELKISRLDRLLKIQRQITSEILAEQVGREVEVLVEGATRNQPLKRFGRSPENRAVCFDGDAAAGSLVAVRVDRSSPSALFGQQIRLH